MQRGRQCSEPEVPRLRPRALWGLVNRKERWSLSRRGWLLLWSFIIGGVALFLFGVHPFLAPTHRTQTEILVVEGWVHNYAIRAAVAEFLSRGYQRVFTTGGPVVGSGPYSNDFNTSASVAADLLKGAGLSSNLIQMVPSRIKDRDRTYSSALALRHWLHKHNVVAPRLNVLTEGAHARRTRLLYQKAFGPDVEIGIIAVPNEEYPASRWWRYSEGVKEVITETAAYLYARLFFHPDDPATDLRS